jgi:peroxiredoxin
VQARSAAGYARERPGETAQRLAGGDARLKHYAPGMRTTALLSIFSVALLGACTRKTDNSSAAPAEQKSAAAAVVSGTADVGKPAPEFKLKDLDGKDHSLGAHKGKVVVLEWFNPECPFVRNAHTKGSLKGLAAKHTTNGVVWLAVNSGAPGKQGHDVEAKREGAKNFALGNPILRDESGALGRAYGATNTPHLYVIDKNGVLVYAGAIDNSPDGEGESPTDGTLINYVDAALADLAAGKAVRTARTKAYGCSVKYGS